MGDIVPAHDNHYVADISRSMYAIQTRKLLDVIDNIRDIGSQLNVDLPRIVVIGNQSAGKSSLIEAIARINVPRGGGTCTRCPSEIRLRHSDTDWQCSISLRFEYDSAGTKLSDAKPVPFGPPLDSEDRSKVELMLRRAQLAILNPETPSEMYLHIDPENMETPSTQLAFSKNVICIEVSGPELTDLTFVDVPGIISSVSDPSQAHTIEFIKSMTREYISGSSLILVTITMSDDMDNQSAILEARKADPEGKRTIGVLTKPDKLQSGEQRQWLPLMYNEGQHSSRLGYYVTKQPTLEEVENKISFDAARQSEAHFFLKHEPWASLPDHIHKRIGTVNLSLGLSALLIEHIRQMLPFIINTIHGSLRQVQEEISQLPAEPSDNPIGELIQLCQKFASELNNHIEGTDGHERLVQKNNEVYADFKARVRSTAPVFVPYTAEELEYNQGYTEPDFISDDLETAVHSDNIQNLGHVRAQIDASKTRELPHSIPFNAKVRMMLLPIKIWPGIADDCFQSITPVVSSVCEEVIGEVFAPFEPGMLRRRVNEIVAEQVALCAVKTDDALNLILSMEKHTYTQNHRYFNSIREKLIAHYRDTRKNRNTTPPSFSSRATSPYIPQPSRDTLISEALSKLELLGYSGLTSDDFAKMIKADPYEQEITVMAETRAYFEVAYKRIVDNVPQVIDQVFVRPLATVLHGALVAGLEINTKDGYDRCRELLAESPSIAAKRDELHARRTRLERAKEALRPIGY